MITEEIKKSIEKSVLCWLATSSEYNIPNVSPKEIFTHFNDDKIIIANIASPNSVKNIENNKFVCVSFIDVFVQKGYQIKGIAELVSFSDIQFSEMEKLLAPKTGGLFPITMIISILITDIKPIIAPKYKFYPDTSEEEQIDNAIKTYEINKYLSKNS